jgi:2-oxoisovalerate dehydrogenase E1 component
MIDAFEEDEVVLVCSGEGATSEGEFWESLNTACTLKLPVVYLIQDNGYAISVPVEVNTAGGSISKLVSGFPNLFVIECDGTDVLDSHQATAKAVRHCRLRRGPALVHCHTTRPHSHSMSDDQRAYRTAAVTRNLTPRQSCSISTPRRWIRRPLPSTRKTHPTSETTTL